jgi:hypothetical protein
MRKTARITVLALIAVAITGCVERRYVIYTDHPGAIVVRNGQTIGATPVDDYFTYYGTYHFTIFADGYETMQVDQKIRAPWYEWPGLDFISENILPWPILDRREFRYTLQPKRLPDTEQLLSEAAALRARGLALPSAPAAPQPIVAPPPGAPVLQPQLQGPPAATPPGAVLQPQSQGLPATPPPTLP